MARQSKDCTPTGGDVAVTEPVKDFYVGISGDLTVLLSKNALPVTFKNVPAGTIFHDLKVKLVLQAGTTAGNIIALW